MSNAPSKNFTARMVEQFRRPEQGAGQFAAELKALTPADKDWYHRELNKAGLPTDAPTTLPAPESK